MYYYPTISQIYLFILIMLFRALSTTAICSGRARTTPLIKKFPVTLRLQYPYYDTPTLAVFPSYQKITDYLLMYRHFLIEQLSGRLILPDQVDQIDPDRIYDVGGTGLPFHENGLMREQVWDRVFETKTALALKEALERKDPNVTELPRVIKGKSGKEVGEWDGVYELSDGCVVFLETKYRMSKAHIKDQSKRVSKSLRAMAKNPRAKLYLAAYHWPDEESCISYARDKGYGILQPNGSGLTIRSEAKDQDFEHE